MKIILINLFIFLSLSANFKYYDVHTLDEFNDFKVYTPKSGYFQDNLKLKKGELLDESIEGLNKLYSYEKMVRDLLLVLSQKYDYNFMQYVAMLTHTQLLSLNAFYKKYNIIPPEDLSKVGAFNSKEITDRYNLLLVDSLVESKTAAKLSVVFMKELVKMYTRTLKNLPKGFKRQLLKTNAFNKKILRMFKKGLRNIELGLPIE